MRPRGVTRSLKAGRTDGWIDGGQGAVDARAVAVGRYFRTVRSATKDGQAAEEREAGRTDGRTSSSYRPGSVKGGGRIPNGGRRRTSPAPQPPLFLSPSPFFLLPFAVTAAVDLAVWLAAADRQQQQRERGASEKEEEEEGAAAPKEIRTQEGTSGAKFAHLGFITCP